MHVRCVQYRFILLVYFGMNMAVAIEFINILVNMDRLAEVYPGGRASLLSPNFKWGYHDGEILRLGAMNDYDSHLIIKDLERLGLEPKKDFGGFSLPWLEFTNLFDRIAVKLKGSTNGLLIHSDNFQEHLDMGIKAKDHHLLLFIEKENEYLVIENSNGTLSMPTTPVEVRKTAVVTISNYLKKRFKMDIHAIERIPQADVDLPNQYRTAFKITPAWHSHFIKPRGLMVNWKPMADCLIAAKQ